MKKLGVRAWRVSFKGYDDVIAFTTSLSKAKMMCAENLHMNYSYSYIFSIIKARRAREYDNYQYCGEKPTEGTFYSEEYLKRRNNLLEFVG